MSKQNEIESLRSDMEAVNCHLRGTLKMTEQGVREAMDALRERVEALEAEALKPEPEPDMTPGPEDVGRWVMVWHPGRAKYGPLVLSEMDISSRFPYGAGGDVWQRARIVPGPIRGMLQEHDGSPEKPEWLRHDDIVIIEYANDSRVLVDEAHTALWGDVVRYQKLEVK